ncbi:NUDIX hydrolase [Candidatus Woesearchaeota archaeon]|nr:NUDIX hydrolase [Candidatus Woesearchaeota archaeon]
MHFLGLIGEYVLIQNHENKFLFLEWASYTKFKNKLHLPGGRSDFEDEAGASLLRELKEEISLNKNDLQEIKPFFLKKTFNEYPRYSVIFSAKIKKEAEKKVKIGELEHFSKIHWLTKEEILKMPKEKLFLEFTKELIQKV